EALRAAYEIRAPISKPEVDGGRASLAEADDAGEPSPSFPPEPVREGRPRDENDVLRERFQTASHDERVRIVAVLVQRGAATGAELAFHDAQRTRTPPRPIQPLTFQAWERLVHPDEDRAIGNIFGVTAPAVLVGRISAMRRDRMLPRLDPARRQDPA